MSDENAKLTGLDAAKRGQWAREALHGIGLRTKRFGEFVGAVRELMATLPKCDEYDAGFDGTKCGRPATWTVSDSYADSGDREHYCDSHAEDRKKRTWAELPYAPALRKLQAMLDPEETEKP